MSRPPVAFMSYVRFDDQHENGRLTTFRERLSAEVRMQTGEEFPIFQDRSDIKWGQSWKERLEESLDAVTFLIPIITPSFFRSAACREELQRFLEREKRLSRSDLVLPVYYVRTPALDDAAKRAADELAQAIAAHQYADWRDLRFEPFTTPVIGKTLAQMASQIAEALERVQEPPKTSTPASSTNRSVPPSSAASIQAAPQRSEAVHGPSAKTEPPTRVVDQMHRGDHVTITEAIKAAKPGDRILVRPGLYQEGLVIDKPLEIIGDGQREEIVIQASGKNVILFKATMGRVANLTLRQIGGKGKQYGVDIAQGRLDLEDCDITSESLACVGIHDGADPRLRRNRIHHCMEGGVYIYESGQGTLEENDIYGNDVAGIGIKTGSNPTVRRNRIHDGKQAGVHIYKNGRGALEENDIFGNAYSGIHIKEGGNPAVQRNYIHDNKQAGVYIYENGQGMLEENDIFDNANAGIASTTGGNPIVRHNRINKNGDAAVWIFENGAGTFEDNDLRDNAGGAWDISEDSLPHVKRSNNLE